MNTIQIQRVYDHTKTDGAYRILVDRLWPRGIKKIDLQLDEWNKDLAPSTELRKWFDHKTERFTEFAALYKEELWEKEDELNRLRTLAKTTAVSLLYGAKDPEINHAIILRTVLLKSHESLSQR